jgi:hypothetical protein
LRRLLPFAVLIAIAGCGSDTRTNRPAPPAPIDVTAAIHDKRVQISPARVGGGPVVFIVSNQSRRPQRLTVETAGRAAGTRASSDPIAPQGTGRVSLTVRRGTYVVSAPHAISARLHVGRRRASAQNDLLQP